MTARLWLSLFLTLAVPAAAATAPAPGAFSALYAVHADGFKVGEMQRSFKWLGSDQYEMETVVYTTGVASVFKSDRYIERAVYAQTADGYTPIEFFSRYKGNSKDVVERIRFDWERNVAWSLRDGEETELPVEAGVFDKLSYQAMMREDLLRGLKTLRYQVADRGKIEEYALEVIGEEHVVTPMGTVRTVKIQKGTTTLWCAIDWDYLPVKLEQVDDGHLLSSYILSARRAQRPTEAKTDEAKTSPTATTAEAKANPAAATEPTPAGPASEDPVRPAP